jgi:pimeloyl-ACP methyl ester carboxylesterase
MTHIDNITINAAGVDLNVNSLGATDLPPVVLLHGIRDVGLSLLPIAQQLSDRYRVHLLDLRGHGRSARPDSYSMAAMLYDLHSVIDALCDTPPALVGHSLGGQITTRFAATFPAAVSAIVVIEGIGPPPPRDGVSARALLDREAQRIIRIMSARMRDVASIDEAAERLRKNNPRLSAERAYKLATVTTEPNSDGSRAWAFDPRAQSVFLAARDAKFYWPLVECPTLLIAGALADEYWSQSIPINEHWNGKFADGQLDDIAAQFGDAEWVEFDGSGHMIHFDEPERLASTTRDFLQQRYQVA